MIGTRFLRDGYEYLVRERYMEGMWEARGPGGDVVVAESEIRAADVAALADRGRRRM